jgi:hypothetical protein
MSIFSSHEICIVEKVQDRARPLRNPGIDRRTWPSVAYTLTSQCQPLLIPCRIHIRAENYLGRARLLGFTYQIICLRAIYTHLQFALTYLISSWQIGMDRKELHHSTKFLPGA